MVLGDLGVRLRMLPEARGDLRACKIKGYMARVRPDIQLKLRGLGFPEVHTDEGLPLGPLSLWKAFKGF